MAGFYDVSKPPVLDVGAIQSHRMQSKLDAMKLRDYEKKVERETGIRNVYAEAYQEPAAPQPGAQGPTRPGGMGYEEAISGLYGMGEFEQAQATQAFETEQAKQQAATKKTISETKGGELDEAEAANKKAMDGLTFFSDKHQSNVLGGMSETMSIANMQPAYERTKQHYADKVDVSEWPQNYDPAWAGQRMAEQLTAKDYLEEKRIQRDKIQEAKTGISKSTKLTDVDDFVLRANEESIRVTGKNLTPGEKNKAALTFKRAQATEVKANKWASTSVTIAASETIARNGERGKRLAQIETAGDLATAKGEVTPVQKRDNAKNRLSGALAQLSTHYNKLDSLNAVVNVEKPGYDNILARASSSTAGQAMGNALGTKPASTRNKINKLRPLIIGYVRQASEMGAKGMDSEKELEFYLQAVTDPTTDLQSNIAAIIVLDNAYGSGTVAAELSEMVKSPEALAILNRQTPVSKATPNTGKTTISSDAEYNALPSGTLFIDPEGKERTKP